MARATGAQAAAVRRRIKHERRIAELVNPLDKLAATWAWVYAEARRAPHLLHDVINKVHAIGVDLNDREANPSKETVK